MNEEEDPVKYKKNLWLQQHFNYILYKKRDDKTGGRVFDFNVIDECRSQAQCGRRYGSA